MDDPLWAAKAKLTEFGGVVLIPLLVDDPLWGFSIQNPEGSNLGLNPSFSG